MTLYSVPTGPVALSASATKHLWLLASPASTGKPIKLTKVHLGFDGSTAVPSIRWQLYRVVTLGSPAGTTTVPTKYSDVALPTAQTTALTALSTAPTSFEVLEESYITPFGGSLVMDYPQGREPYGAASGSRLGFCVITPSGVTCNAISAVVFDE
jgi:hypothetical protein